MSMSEPERRVPAEAFHPSVYVLEEMDARGWTRDDLTTHMVGEGASDEEWGLSRLGLDFYFSVHDRGLIMGESAIHGFAKAFGISEDFFRNLERSWIEHPSSATPSAVEAAVHERLNTKGPE